VATSPETWALAPKERGEALEARAAAGGHPSAQVRRPCGTAHREPIHAGSGQLWPNGPRAWARPSAIAADLDGLW